MKFNQKTNHWSPAEALLYICTNRQTVTGSINKKHLLTVADDFLRNFKNPSPTNSKSTQERMLKFQTKFSELFRLPKNRSLHPVVWYWFAYKNDKAMISKFTSAEFEKFAASGLSDGVETFIQARKPQRNFSQPNPSTTVNNVYAGIPVTRLVKRRAFALDLAELDWRIPNLKLNVRNPTHSRSQQLESKLLQSLSELKKSFRNQHVTKISDQKYTCPALTRVQLFQLIQLTDVGREIADEYKESTVIRSLSQITTTFRGRPGATQKKLLSELESILKETD